MLCTFHFLQSQWTWLYEGRNKIHKEDRVVLIHEVRKLVYAGAENSLSSLYKELLINSTAQKYPHFIKRVNSLWEKRSLWAHCYRKHLLIRGNHTILKELVFSHVKAFNLVQMFIFINFMMLWTHITRKN